MEYEPVAPVPLRFTTVNGFVNEVLTMVSEPLAVPAVVGSNCTVIAADWLGFKVIGKLSPNTEKPFPVTVAPLTDTGAVPVDITITDCVATEFRLTGPNATLLVLTLRIGANAPSCREYDCNIPTTLAVTATLCGTDTVTTVAVKVALVCPSGTLTVGGTVTDALLLDRPTVTPPLAAAAFKVTMQLSVPGPVITPLAQFTALGTGMPVPLKLTAVEDPFDASLVTVNCPVSAPAAPGLNCTLRL